MSKARATSDTETIATARDRVAELLSTFPLYPDLDLNYLKKVVHLTNSGAKAKGWQTLHRVRRRWS